MPTTALRRPAALPAPQYIPAPKAPVITPGVRAKNRVQFGWYVVMLLSAAFAIGVGVLYLSGHARVTAEGYRRVKLMAQLKQEQARSQRLRELSASAYTPESIESGAKTMGLTRPGDKDMMTAGERE